MRMNVCDMPIMQVLDSASVLIQFSDDTRVLQERKQTLTEIK